MAIQAQLYTNQNGFPVIGGCGSEFPIINNGGIGIDQSYVNNSFLSQKDFNQEALFHHHPPQYQKYRYQSFLDALMEKQKQETEQFIKIQGERLRYVLQEQRKQEIEMIYRKMEGKAMILMSQKEEEMTKALNKKTILEDMLRKLEMENQMLQRMANENEAMVANLNSKLEQVRVRAATVVEDEGSLVYGGTGDSFPTSCSCRNCGSNGRTRVLFLPCRHLCCCRDCEAGVDFCPICNMPKKNIIEALIS